MRFNLIVLVGVSLVVLSSTAKSDEEMKSTATPDAAVPSCSEEAELTVVEASSVYQNNTSSWGPQLALTDPSKNGYDGYWHSDSGDMNPWIEFKMSNVKEVSTVEVVDRYSYANKHRFEQVEVRVGSSSNYDIATSCGIQSCCSSNFTYIYRCPDDTVGLHIFIKKLGSTQEYLHVNHVTVMACTPSTTSPSTSTAQTTLILTGAGILVFILILALLVLYIFKTKKFCFKKAEVPVNTNENQNENNKKKNEDEDDEYYEYEEEGNYYTGKQTYYSEDDYNETYY